MYTALHINTRLAVRDNNVTHTDVIWVIQQQQTKVLILLMTKTCLCSLWPLPRLVPARGHNVRTHSSVGCQFSETVLALMKGEMKGRREGETGCLVSSLPAEEILLEQGCGNAKASSEGLSGAPKASLAGCKQRGLWEITRDQSGRLMPSSSGTFSSRNRDVGQAQRERERERNLSRPFFQLPRIRPCRNLLSFPLYRFCKLAPLSAIVCAHRK